MDVLKGSHRLSSARFGDRRILKKWLCLRTTITLRILDAATSKPCKDRCSIGWHQLICLIGGRVWWQEGRGARRCRGEVNRQNSLPARSLSAWCEWTLSKSFLSLGEFRGTSHLLYPLLIFSFTNLRWRQSSPWQRKGPAGIFPHLRPSGMSEQTLFNSSKKPCLTPLTNPCLTP